ncbi:MAG: arsenite efflux transporter metallochaperone ArsD [Atopobium sp.]|jgi:hypothetical protein|nr:arsenite efflux transporter metallochaperone ArsD [Atopobium sp.]
MHEVTVFDPAMCCPTGVCGPSVDPEALRISGVLDALKTAGLKVSRHSLSQEPQEFVDNKEVAAILSNEGAKALPLTFVDGKLLSKGSYPSNEVFSNTLGVTLPKQAEASSCCSSGAAASDEDASAGSCCSPSVSASDADSSSNSCCCGPSEPASHEDDSSSSCCCGSDCC